MELRLSNIGWTRPAMRSLIAGAPPLYGTWTICVPVMNLNNSPPTWSGDRHFPLGQISGTGRHAKAIRAALAAGVAIDPGAEWSTDQSYGKSRTRLCFANPSHETIRAGIAALAEVCRREFGAPARIANIERRARG